MRVWTHGAGAAVAGLLVWAALGAGALAQGFPERTFDQLAAQDLALVQAQKRTPRTGDLVFNPGQDAAARAEARFTGQSRPIDARDRGFIVAFASAGAGNEGYAQLYRREYRFRSGGKDYWLPVQGQVAGYFDRELKPGDPVTLYLRNAGGFREAQAWRWLFLVEEFKSARTPAAPAKPAPPIPPGPRTGV